MVIRYQVQLPVKLSLFNFQTPRIPMTRFESVEIYRKAQPVGFLRFFTRVRPKLSNQKKNKNSPKTVSNLQRRLLQPVLPYISKTCSRTKTKASVLLTVFRGILLQSKLFFLAVKGKIHLKVVMKKSSFVTASFEVVLRKRNESSRPRSF